MKPDDFEAQLQRQTFRELPAEWEAEILSAAQMEAGQKEPGFWLVLWEELFVKPRMVWGGMAVVWLLALILNLGSGSESAKQMVQQPVEPSPEAMQMVREQQKLRDELLGIGMAAVELSPADRPRDGMKPRSERKEDYAVV